MAFPFLLVGLALGTVGGWWFMNRRFRPVQSQGDGCLVCGSTQLDWIAQGAYRCRGCGYEGGPGWALHRDARKAAEFAALDPVARLASIRSDLQSAHDELVAAVGDLDRALEFWPALGSQLLEDGPLDLLVEDAVPDIEQLTLEGIGRVVTAKRAIGDARLKAASGPTPTSTPIELPHIPWTDDEAASVHLRVRPAFAAATAMLEMVDTARTQHFEE